MANWLLYGSEERSTNFFRFSASVCFPVAAATAERQTDEQNASMMRPHKKQKMTQRRC